MVVGSPFLTLPRPQALVGPWPGELEVSLRWARGTRLVLEDKDSEAVITGYTGTVAAYICRLGVPSGNTHKQLPLSSLLPVVVTPSQVYEGTVSKVKPTKTLPLEVPLPHVDSSGMDLEALWLLHVRPEEAAVKQATPPPEVMPGDKKIVNRMDSLEENLQQVLKEIRGRVGKEDLAITDLRERRGTGETGKKS